MSADKTTPMQLANQLEEHASTAEIIFGKQYRSETERQAAEQLRRIPALEAELERERIRLAACGVVAMCDTPESAARNRQMHPDYESESCRDVARRVDECMALRAERDQLRAEVQALRADAERYRWLKSVPSGFEAQRIVNDTPHGMDASIDKARKQQ